jgi:hypothetical protein
MPFLLMICAIIAGCGTHVPYVGEAWDREGWQEVGVKENLAIRIRTKIFCDLVDAANLAIGVRYVPDPVKGKPRPEIQPVLKNFGVQMQLTITIDETGAIDPSGGVTQVLQNAHVEGVAVSQSRALNSSAVFSSQAVRVDTYYSYFTIERLVNPKNKEFCRENNAIPPDNSYLLSDLRIKEFLHNATYSAAFIHSSPAPTKGNAKNAKFDIFSYDTKFVVITNANVNPVIKLASSSVGSGSQPLLAANRSRTHDLLLTFGPDADGPITAAYDAHFTAAAPTSRPVVNQPN